MTEAPIPSPAAPSPDLDKSAPPLSPAKPFGVVDHLAFLPEAQVRLLSLEWQLERFEAYHTTWATRWSHGLCFFPVVWGVIALASLLPANTTPLFPDAPVPTPLHLGAILCAMLAVWYVAVEPLAGAISALLLTLFGLSANYFNAAMGEWAAPAILLGVIAPAVAFLAISHSAEPIPPPWSGTRGMMDWKTWLATASWQRKLGFFVVGFIAGHILEFWAAMRFIPIVVLRFLHDHFGYRRALVAAARAKAPALRQEMTGFVQDMESETPAP